MEQQTVVTSGLGSINTRDLIQGAVMAGLGAGAGLLYPVIAAWSTGEDVVLNVSLIWKASVGAGVLHIVRKFLSPPVVVITKPTQEVVQAVKDKEATIEVKTPASDNPVMELNQRNQKSSI